MNILKSYLPVIYANKYLYMRKNTPVYCRLNLYENLRELMGIKSNTFCLYERKKYIKVFYNNNFDKVCVVLCCLFPLIQTATCEIPQLVAPVLFSDIQI